jgi:UDP:flavonoid glycosyltransferase YjiC (YdhE family)
MRSRPLKILFMAEAVTLAHVARLAVLARSLDPRQHEIAFASAPRYSSLFHDFPFPIRPIRSISEEQFLNALAHGKPLHDIDTLRSYVAEDLTILREIQPDVVVGDLRHSLAVSARKERVPYVSLVNAYWSPYARQQFCVPEIPLVRVAGYRIANALFQLARPFAFAAHCTPMNQLLEENGFAPVGRDLRRMYTDADRVIYPDVPEMVPTESLPPTHSYVGPILWSPSVGLPDWWRELPQDRPLVYVTVGSSGSINLLRKCMEAVDGEPVIAIAATVARRLSTSVPANVRTADFLPGLEASKRASLVISNGGSPTSHQAIAGGTPVLGLPSNMDQHLSMSYLAATGAGLMLRSDQAKPRTIREYLRRALGDVSLKTNAERMQLAFSQYDAAARFRAVLDEVSASLATV